MFFNQYPYTDNNQLNLDWLLNTVQTVASGFDSVQEIAEQASTDAASALETLESVETDFSETVAELQAIVDEYKETIEADVAATMLEYVTAWTTALEAARTELTAYVDSNVSDLSDSIEEAVETLEAQIAAISVNLQVVNPYTGETTGLQELLSEMLEWDRLFAWTAEEFDSYELMTAEYFDSFDLSCKEWDFAGRFYQYWKVLWEALPSVDLDELNNRVTILENMDTTPTEGSTRACTSGGIYDAISAISTLSFEVVTSLPTEDIQTDVIYLILSETASDDNIYDEYIYINESWEIIGSTSIDLSNYLQTSDVDTELSTSSGNPIANSVVASAFENMFTAVSSYSRYQCTSTDPEYTGASVTIPAGAYFVLTLENEFSNAVPTFAGISDSESTLTYNTLEYGNLHGGGEGVRFVNIGGCTRNETTFYAWGAWATASTYNAARLRGCYWTI